MAREDRKIRRKVRNSYIISTISISLVLFLLGSVGYLILSALDISDRMKESISLHVFLDDGLEPHQRESINDKLLSEEGVREVVYRSKDDAAAEFISFGGEDFSDVLEFNPLQAYFEVGLSASSAGKERISELDRAISGWEGVDEVVYQKNVVEQAGAIGKFNLVLLSFGLALLLISIILLNNTIRATIYAKRYVISTMKMVGATKGFIIRPFAAASFRQGLLSAFLGGLMFAGLLVGLNESLPELRASVDPAIVLWIVGGMFVTGIVISMLFTIFAVNKFVRLPTNAIHFY